MLHIKLRRFWSHFWGAWQSGGVWSAMAVGRQDLLTATRNRLRPLVHTIFFHMSQLIYFFYYRLVFGRSVLGEKKLSSLVHSLEKRQRKEDIPESKEVWDFQYLNKMWDYLSNNEEVSRYSVIIGYIQHFKPEGSILDIGCGMGILQERLSSFGYSRYVGIDISDTAIQRAHLKEDTKTVFINGDADSYSPLESFDIIIFNEILYCLDNPLEIFARYTNFLKENGIIITSIQHTIRSTAVRRRIKKLYPTLVETKITNTYKDLTWFCNVFVPSKKTR